MSGSSVQEVNNLQFNQGLYPAMTTNNFNQGSASKPVDFSFPSFGGFANTVPLQQEKVGFWEGTKAFLRGALLKPIKSLWQNKLKSVLMIGAVAALMIGTAGAAGPLLITLGLGFGAFQIGKGGYNFFTKNSKAERLAALEDMGEGTFTVGAALIGARSYARGTAGGSAVDAALSKDGSFLTKAGSVAKGFAQDSLTTLKAAPGAVRQTGSMILSGEFKANIVSASKSVPLAVERRRVAALAEEKGRKSKEFLDALAKYTEHRKNFSEDIIAKSNELADTYLRNIGSKGSELAYQRITEDGLLSFKNIQWIKEFALQDSPSACIGIGIGDILNPNIDPETLQMAQMAGKAAGFDPMKELGIDPMKSFGMTPEATLGIA